jgi:hypothetical protein
VLEPTHFGCLKVGGYDLPVLDFDYNLGVAFNAADWKG